MATNQNMSVLPTNPVAAPRSGAAAMPPATLPGTSGTTTNQGATQGAPMSVAPLSSQEIRPSPSPTPAAPISVTSQLAAVYDRNTADPARNAVRTQATGLQLPSVPSSDPDPALLGSYMSAQARGLVPPLSYGAGEDVNARMRDALASAGRQQASGQPLPQTTPDGRTIAAFSPLTNLPSGPLPTRDMPEDGEPWRAVRADTPGYGTGAPRGVTGTTDAQGRTTFDYPALAQQPGGGGGGNSSAAPNNRAEGTYPGTSPAPSSGRTFAPVGSGTQAAAAAGAAGSSSSEDFLRDFLRQQAGLNTLTAEEQASVEQAGRDADAMYAPVIAEAKEEKKQGMAKGLIAAGQSGGFLNSQFAGIGAFVPTEGGTFIGQGGSLMRLQDNYSNAIANLEGKRIAAIRQAMAQRTEAIRTGKVENMKLAKDAFDMAMQIDREKRAVAQEGLDRLVKLQQLKKYEKDDDMETFKAISEAGIDVDDEYFQELDAKYGRPQGTYKTLWTVQQDVRRDKNIDDQLERETKMQAHAKSIIDIADKMGTNVPVYVDGHTYTYQGRKAEDYESGTQTDNMGRMTYWEYNRGTGATKTVDMGFVGQAKDGWTRMTDDSGNPWMVNSKTRQTVPAFPSQTMATWQAVVPDGATTTPWRSAADPMSGQCGAVMNDCNDPEVGRIWGDTLAQKMAVVKGKNPVTGENWEVPVNQAMEGDTLVMAYGTTGHVARVNQREVGPDGVPVYRLFEANAVPPGGRQISSTRTVRADDPKIVGAARVPTRPELLAGPDSPVTSAAIGLRRPTFGGLTADQMLAKSDEWRSERLSGEELKATGLPYGTTRGEAQDRGIIPGAAPSSNLGVNLPSFEEFSRQAEKELAKDPNVLAINPNQLREMYDRTVGAAPSYLDGAYNLSFKFTDKKGPAFVADVQKAIEAGDFERAKDKLMKGALDTADSTTAQQVRGRDASLRALLNIQQDLGQFVARGGNTNIFTGTREQIANKVGMVYDAEARRIATKIQAAVSDYRKSVSGASFTEQEKAEYDSMFPSVSSSQALNTSRLEGLLEVFRNSNETFYRQQLGNQNYDAIFGS